MRQNSGAAEAKAVDGRVVIRLPRSWFNNKQRYFSLKLPVSPENLAYGVQIAARINSDFSLNQFDRTLAKYKPQNQPQYENYSVRQLWLKYCAYKAPRWKAKTQQYYEIILGRHIENMPQDWQSPLEIRTWLLKNTSNGMTIRVLNSLQTVITWAIRMRLIPEQRNPFEQMGADLGVSQQSAAANAFSPAEEQQVIQAFYDSETWHYYGVFVEFLFLSGCRPSEAVGLQWEQVSPDFKNICFDRSVVKIGSEYHINHFSKTNRSRNFPCSERLRVLMAELDGSTLKQGAVFEGKFGMVNYEHLAKRAWPAIVSGAIGRKSTPYSCRDTFITRQIAAGKPPVLVAKWVDNSVAMIERKYLDISAILTIRPD